MLSLAGGGDEGGEEFDLERLTTKVGGVGGGGGADSGVAPCGGGDCGRGEEGEEGQKEEKRCHWELAGSGIDSIGVLG